jgi:hypothetical protein
MSVRDLLFGRPLSSREQEGQKVGVVAGIPLLGLDALSSVAYGPLLLAIFGGVRRHYHRVSVEIANPNALDVSNIQPPIVILPMSAWNKMSQKGLRFALKLSPEIFVVQIRTGSSTEDDLRRRWPEYVEAPTSAARLAVPKLVELTSPYRYVFNPDRQVAVLIPELVARHWYEHLLHNKRAALLKALLLVRGDQDIVVINVPWYLSN